MTEDTKTCPVCDSDMEKDEFDGDWLVFTCESDDCGTKIESPMGDPQEDGFTMESLKRASDYADDDL